MCTTVDGVCTCTFIDLRYNRTTCAPEWQITFLRAFLFGSNGLEVRLVHLTKTIFNLF